MSSSGVRWGAAASVAVVLAMFAGACSSSGSARVSTDSRAKQSSTSSATTSTGAATSSSTKTAARKAAKRKAAVTSSSAGANKTGTTIVQVQLGDTTPPTSGPTLGTSATTPTTVARTTTTLDGPKPYDPTKPIDLGGEPGVTPAEQHRAEQLVRDTLRDLPKYADVTTASAAGYRSIGDAATGDEHWVNWAYVNDNHILDSKFPESLVYEVRNGKRKLVAAMYTLKPGDSFADVPDVGGPLTQWHVHNNLCLEDNPSDPLQKVVSGLTSADGTCPAGSTKAGAIPMIHVWIVANACGPFASLEGIGAGQVPPGQTRHCDSAHG